MKRFETRLRQAMPAARELLATGIDPLENDGFWEILPAGAPELGPFFIDDDRGGAALEWAREIYVVGIAVGMLLNASIYLSEAARISRSEGLGDGRPAARKGR
jgi:hypothetical protein